MKIQFLGSFTQKSVKCMNKTHLNAKSQDKNNNL